MNPSGGWGIAFSHLLAEATQHTSCSSLTQLTKCHKPCDAYIETLMYLIPVFPGGLEGHLKELDKAGELLRAVTYLVVDLQS